MDKIEDLLTGILMCEPGSLPPESTPLRAIKGWDSLKHVLLVIELEKRLKTQLTAEEIQRLNTLADVRELVEKRSIDA